LRHFEVPDGDTAIAVTANELLALVVPAYRSQRLRTKYMHRYLHGAVRGEARALTVAWVVGVVSGEGRLAPSYYGDLEVSSQEV